MTLSLYVWNTDWATTAASDPVFVDTTTFVDWVDNDYVPVELNGEFDPGTYLWVLSEGKKGVGLWGRPEADDASVVFYIDGEEITDRAFDVVANGYIWG